MTYKSIRYETGEGIATLTLSRPDHLNAVTPAMIEEMIDAFDRADADDAVRAIIVTGDGRAFCAGGDLSRGGEAFDFSPSGDPGPDGAGLQLRDDGGRLTLRIFESLKPVIAAINGAAVGIGATMTLAMDVRIASRSARLGFVFARLGIVPEAASSWFLPRIVGISRALEWCCTGRLITAEEALTGGLVRSVHDPEDVLTAARALAHEIATHAAPVSVALTRQMMWRGLGSAHPMEAHRIDSRGIASRGRSPDVVEGVKAFKAKRLPHFQDRVSSDMPDFFPWWTDEDYR